MIQNYLNRCAFFIVMLSPNAVQRENVRKEIALAIEKNKKILPIFLEQTELTHGLQLQLNTVQSCYYYQMDEETAYQIIFRSLPPFLKFQDQKEMDNSIKIVVSEINKFIESKSWDEGVRFVKLLLKNNPHTADYWYYLAIIYEFSNRIDDAFKSINSAVQIDATNSIYTQKLTHLRNLIEARNRKTDQSGTQTGILKYSGNYILNEDQVDRLKVHVENIMLLLFDYINLDFKLFANGNWPMLGHNLIDLFQTADPEGYRDLSIHMLNPIIEEPSAQPFAVTSIAQMGLTNLKGFQGLLQELIKSTHPNGLIHFQSGYLGLGDHFSTLWSLRILYYANELEHNKELVSRAIEAIAHDFDVLTRSSDFIGFFLFVLVHIDKKKYSELIERCVTTLLDEQSTWIDNFDIRSGGFTAYDLLFVIDIFPRVMQAVETWLLKVFELNAQEIGLPSIFQKLKNSDKISPDVWLQSWIRAVIAAILYLKIRRPLYTPLSEHFVKFFHETKRLKIINDLYVPYVPNLNAVLDFNKIIEPILDKNPFEINIFFYSTFNSSIPKDILEILGNEVQSQKFNPIFYGDRDIMAMIPGNIPAEQVFLRICKYMVIFFDPKKRNELLSLAFNSGFFIAKGGLILEFPISTMSTREVQKNISLLQNWLKSLRSTPNKESVSESKE